MNAMKQAYSLDPLQPSMWTTFLAFSVSTSLLLLFSGAVGITLAWITSPPRILRGYALLGTVFWTAAFIRSRSYTPLFNRSSSPRSRCLCTRSRGSRPIKR